MKRSLHLELNYDDNKINESDVRTYICDILNDNKHPCIEINIKF